MDWYLAKTVKTESYFISEVSKCVPLNYCSSYRDRRIKSENPRLALTHAIASQTAEIYMADGDSVVRPLSSSATVCLNAVKGQPAMKLYGVTSTESHIKSSLQVDVPIWVCKEDMERLGLKEDQMVADARISAVPI